MRVAKLLVLISCLGLCGCSFLDFISPDSPPYYRELWEIYNQTNLKESTSADVLTTIRSSKYDLLSQSKSVVASLGQKKRTYHTWFNMVAFDENELTANRKHLLVINERPKVLLSKQWEGVTYDSEMVLEAELLDKPYADENTRRIAILKQVLENIREDTAEVAPDNKMLDICGMVVNQALRTVLVKLDSSPVLASKLSEPAGLAFSHPNLDRGKIQMLIEGDVVVVKMMLGSFVRYFQKRERPRHGADSS